MCPGKDGIAEMCRKTAELVFLTQNGEGDLVVMDIETYNRREKMLKLHEELLAVEEDRMHGSKGYSVDEVAAMMRGADACFSRRIFGTGQSRSSGKAYRFILFEKKYMIIFQIIDHIVYADYVVDCRQDYSWLIR